MTDLKKQKQKKYRHKLDRVHTCNTCKDRCVQQLSAELSGGALPFQRHVWRRPSLICASSAREYTQNRPKSIKKCKWSPQIVYIINFIHNSQEKCGSFQYKLAKQTRRDALQPRHFRLGDNLSSVAGSVWHQRNWENIEPRTGRSEEKVGKRRWSREAKSQRTESNGYQPKRRWTKDGMKGEERRETREFPRRRKKWRSKEKECSGSKLPPSFAGYSSVFGKEGTLINKTIIKMDESGGTIRSTRREYVKSSWCGIIFIINRVLAAAAGALGFWLHQQSTVHTETLTLYCCVTLSSALSELMSAYFRRRRCSPRCIRRWASVCAATDESSAIG